MSEVPLYSSSTASGRDCGQVNPVILHGTESPDSNDTDGAVGADHPITDGAIGAIVTDGAIGVPTGLHDTDGAAGADRPRGGVAAPRHCVAIRLFGLRD